MVQFPNAKVNLGLNIMQKRTDGYHNIETIFYPVKGLCDILEVIVSDGEPNSIEFTQSGLSIDSDMDSNLCVKAYRLLASRYRMPHVKMHLHKIIPMGAGLGGGSSDAAFTLKMLNSLLQEPLSTDMLLVLALELGSDCPFFILNSPSVGRERGEILEPISVDLTGYWILLVNPGIHIGTRDAYEESCPKQWDIPIGKLVNFAINEWPQCLLNDFEKTIFPKYPAIAAIKEELYRIGAVYASMSGSGSTMLGIFREKPTIPESFSGHYTHVSML